MCDKEEEEVQLSNCAINSDWLCYKCKTTYIEIDYNQFQGALVYNPSYKKECKDCCWTCQNCIKIYDKTLCGNYNCKNCYWICPYCNKSGTKHENIDMCVSCINGMYPSEMISYSSGDYTTISNDI
jgi:hypothetical protein